MRPGTSIHGRYEFVRELGAGGAGELLLVRDRGRDGRPLALKVLRPRMPDPGLTPLFRSEFLLLSDVDHPNIVGVHDFGILEPENAPFFTMDYVPGENCRTFVKQERLELAEYLDLATGMLGALAHVHARGVLHRDVKPENIIMQRGDGRLDPILIDFGLAISSTANRAGEASGTVPYIAPEVLAGARPDVSTDLFSLGMVLFELGTGRYVADRRELLRAPARTLAPDRVRRALRRSARGCVPRRFEEFVSRLLAPAPAGRYRSANEALAALAQLYGDEYGVGGAEGATARSLGDPPFVGRTAAVDALVQRVEALLEGRLLEPTVVVGGAAGMGVTRLLATVRNQAAVLGCIVCSGSNLRDLARDVVSHPTVADGAHGVGESAREHVLRIDNALHDVPHEQVVLLALDDLHAATEAECVALREWIAALERRTGRVRQLLVLAGRTDEESPGAEILRTAGGSVPVELRELSPLSIPDVRAALASLLDQSRVPAPVVQSLRDATGGNPRLFGEVLQILVDEEVLDLSGDRPVLMAERLKDVKLPEGVAEAARRRLRRLDQKGRELLRRLAVIDEALPHAAAAALAGDRLRAFVDAGLLVRDRGRVRFPSELTRRGADTLRGRPRRDAQVEMGRALAETAPRTAALLLAAAAEFEAARAIGLPVARELQDQGNLEVARALLKRLAGDAPDLETGAMLVAVNLRIGRRAEAAEIGLELLHREFDTDLVLATASALSGTGRPRDALDLLASVDHVPDGDLGVRVTNAKAALLSAMGRFDEALAESRKAEAKAGGLPGLHGNVGRVRAVILRQCDQTMAARRVDDVIVAAPPGAVADHIRVPTLVTRGNEHLGRGRLRRALRDLRAAAVAAGTAGRLDTRGRAVFNLGLVLLRAGRCERALLLAGAARRLFERSALGEAQARALVLEARALTAAGRPGEAEQRLARAQSLPGFERYAVARAAAAAARAALAIVAGRAPQALKDLEGMLGEEPESDEPASTACLAAECSALFEEPDQVEASWRAALRRAWRRREGEVLPWIRVGLAECAAAKGGWHLAERLLGAREVAAFQWRTPLRARWLLLRAGAALSRGEPASGARLIEEAIAAVNRCDDAVALAGIYAGAASLLEDLGLQRFVRRPTAAGSVVLLEGAREIWLNYGNEDMLRKIDLHLAELPRAAGDPQGGPEADRLVKVLHITREMNREPDRDRLLGLILDRAIELTGAERGFVILLKEGREEVHIARNIDRESVSDPDRKVSTQVIREVTQTGRIVRSEDAELDHRFDESLSVRQLRLKSIIAVPFRANGRTVGALYLDNRFRTGSFSDQDERLLELFADQAVAAIERAALMRELAAKNEQLEEANRLQKAQLRQAGKQLDVASQELKQHRRARGWGFEKIVARSVSMQGLVREAKRVAKSELPVMVTGENGTGKEVMARAIHYASLRKQMSFVAVNCAAFPEGLLESELFGHVRGSFTGADRDRAGLFEEADGGTLFLDEVGDMALPMQVKLLRALETGEIRRIGESTVRNTDVRVIAATNADLEAQIRGGRFREDLYYRLSGFVLRIPPLRERLEDIEPLAYAFVEEASRREARPGLEISNDAIAKLESTTWAGNVRELRNVILRAVVTAASDVIRPEDIKFDSRGPTVMPGLDPTVADRFLAEIQNRGIELNPRQQTALTRVLTRGKLTFGEYKQLFRVSKSTTARDLDALLGEGLLEKRGKTRAVTYLSGPLIHEIANKVGGQ